jgi:hypothetical protein
MKRIIGAVTLVVLTAIILTGIIRDECLQELESQFCTWVVAKE